MLFINYKGNTPQQRFYTIGVQDNNKANKICFLLNSIQQDVDLSTLTPYLKIKSKDSEYIDKILLTESSEEPYDNTILKITWELTSKSTQYRNLELQLQFQSDDDEQVVWQTMIVEIELSETIPLSKREMNEKELTEISQLEKLVNTFDKRINDVEEEVESAITENDIVDDLESEDSKKVLSAKQGKVLNDKISNAISGVYRPQGSSTIQVLNALNVDETMNGFVFDMLDSGTLTKGSVQVMEGDNVAIIWNEDKTDWKWDKLSGLVDLSNYYTKTESNQKFVDLDTTQTITGEKTFNNEIKISNGIANLFITNNGYTSLIEQQSGAGLYLTGTQVNPNANGTKDLGSRDYYWKDIYANGTAYIGNIKSPTTYLVLQGTNGALTLGGEQAQFNVDLLPTGSTQSLGLNSRPWKDCHLSGKSYYYNSNTTKYAFITLDQWGNLNIGLNVGTGDYNFFAFSNTEFFPTSSNSKSLGTLNYTWKNLYLSDTILFKNTTSSTYWRQQADISGNLVFGFGTDGLNWSYAGWFDAQGSVYLRNVYPITANTYDLGDNLRPWRNLCLNGKIDLGTRVSGRTTTSYIDLDPYDGVRIYCNNKKSATFYDNGVYIDEKLLPNTPTGDLGDNSHVWNYAYVNNLSNGTGTLTSHCDFIPSATNALDLGNSTYKWKNLFLSGNISDGNNANYGLALPDTTNYTADKTIATTDDIADAIGNIDLALQGLISGGGVI